MESFSSISTLSINQFTPQLPHNTHVCSFLMHALPRGSATAGFAPHSMPSTEHRAGHIAVAQQIPIEQVKITKARESGIKARKNPSTISPHPTCSASLKPHPAKPHPRVRQQRSEEDLEAWPLGSLPEFPPQPFGATESRSVSSCEPNNRLKLCRRGGCQSTGDLRIPELLAASMEGLAAALQEV